MTTLPKPAPVRGIICPYCQKSDSVRVYCSKRGAGVVTRYRRCLRCRLPLTPPTIERFTPE